MMSLLRTRICPGTGGRLARPLAPAIPYSESIDARVHKISVVATDANET
jgi:hypothetical protein